MSQTRPKFFENLKLFLPAPLFIRPIALLVYYAQVRNIVRVFRALFKRAD